MTGTYTGICSGFEGTKGTTCSVIPGPSSIEVHLDGRLVGSLAYGEVELSLTGADNAYVCFTKAGTDGAVNVMVRGKVIMSRIESLGAPRAVMDQWGDMVAQGTRRAAFWWGIVLAVAGVIALVVFSIWQSLPAVADKAVAMIPPDWETSIGEAGSAGLIEETPVCMDEDLNRAVVKILTRLVGGVGANPYQFKVWVLDSEEVNAMALPGGYIFVNRGLIEYAEDPEEVAGVLAHEIQHVLLRHGLSNLVRQAGLMLLLYAALGDAGALQQFLGYNALSLLSMSFSRDQETEADTHGIELLKRSRLALEPMPRFFHKLAEEESSLQIGLTLLSTHPNSKARAQVLESMIKEIPGYQSESLGIDWGRVQGLCTPEKITSLD